MNQNMLLTNEELDQLPPGVALQVDDKLMSVDGYRQYVREQVERVQGDLVRLRDRWVQHRAQSGVEARWRRAAALYFGSEEVESTFVETLKTGPARQKKGPQQPRSRVVVNIVRPKVDQAVARMCEILLPVDDRNWGIKPTPVPESVSRLLGDGRPTVIPGSNTPTGMTAHDEARVVIQASKEAAESMEKVIDDMLTECDYNAEQRKLLEDGVRLGTGIIEGPFPSRQTSKVWTPSGDGTQQMVVKEKIQPASARRDPWDVWFDPSCGNEHQRGQGYWVRRYVTRKEIRALDGMPGYDTDKLRTVLREAPNRVRVAEGRVMRSPCKDESYELWTYHGELEPDCMQLCSLNTGDPLQDVEFGVILMINDHVVGALPSWIPDKSLPIDVWNWRKADDSPYGYGLPDELEHQQRVVNSAWRQVMDNARFAVGDQVVYNGKVVPQDGDWTITPGKLWRADPDLEDVGKAFATFGFGAHLQELLAIATTAMQFADQETSMPQLMGGEQGTAPETVGGQVMMYNNANATLRLRVKYYDDGVTDHQISRHYDWQMANNPDPNIKGDMEVDARGSTALLEKDVQNQATLNLANITTNPRYSPYLDPKKELQVILKAFKTDPESVMLSDDKIKQMEDNPPQQPPDPKIQSAQINQQTKQLEIQDRQAARQDANQQHQRAADLTHESNELQRELGIAKLASTENQTAATIHSKERLETLKIDSNRQQFNAEAALRVNTGAGI